MQASLEPRCGRYTAFYLLLHDLVETSARLAATRSRLEKTRLLAELLRRAHGRDIELVVDYLSGTLPQGRIGVGWALLERARGAAGDVAAAAAPLALADVDAALARGHEGIMAKDLASPCEAGNRGRAWLKIKRAHTLDLVVVAAEWGHGRRKGWLSNLHLGALDAKSGAYVMLGKTFKGLTDETLEWQTRRLLELETSRDRHTVFVEPTLVVEIAFSHVQESPRYPGGFALRLARVKCYRDDKTVAQADGFDPVRAIWESQIARADG